MLFYHTGTVLDPQLDFGHEADFRGTLVQYGGMFSLLQSSALFKFLQTNVSKKNSFLYLGPEHEKLKVRTKWGIRPHLLWTVF